VQQSKDSRREKPLERSVPNNEHLMMQAESQEPSLINLCQKNKAILEKCIRRGLTTDSFMVHDCKVIFGMLAKHFSNYGSTMDRLTFETEVLKEYPQQEAERLRGVFDLIWNKRISEDQQEHLLDDVEGRDLQIQAYTICSHFFEPLLKQTKDQKDLVEKFQNQVSRIKKHSDVLWTKSSSLAENMPKVWQEIETRRDDPSKFVGIMSGLKCMDMVFNGFIRGKYMVILAMEGGGKTTFMLNLALNMCKMGLNIGYVTVESDGVTTSKRSMTIASKINYNRISVGGKGDNGLNDYAMSQLKKVKDDFEGEFGKRFHWIEVLQGASHKLVIEEINKRMSYTKLDVIFVDYLDVIGSEAKYSDRPDLELADVSAAFQNYGSVHNALVITAQQMKTDKVRELTGKGHQKNKVTGENFNVGVGDVAGSKKISGAADYIFALLVDPNTPGRMYVQTVKARNARKGDKFALAYDQDSGKIEDILPNAAEYENIANEIATGKFKVAPMEQPPDSGGLLDVQPMQTSMGFLTDSKEDVVREWDLIDAGVDFFRGE
jgi:replicative DNA helicase